MFIMVTMREDGCWKRKKEKDHEPKSYFILLRKILSFSQASISKFIWHVEPNHGRASLDTKLPLTPVSVLHYKFVIRSSSKEFLYPFKWICLYGSIIQNPDLKSSFMVENPWNDLERFIQDLSLCMFLCKEL